MGNVAVKFIASMTIQGLTARIFEPFDEHIIGNCKYVMHIPESNRIVIMVKKAFNGRGINQVQLNKFFSDLDFNDKQSPAAPTVRDFKDNMFQIIEAIREFYDKLVVYYGLVYQKDPVVNLQYSMYGGPWIMIKQKSKAIVHGVFTDIQPLKSFLELDYSQRIRYYGFLKEGSVLLYKLKAPNAAIIFYTSALEIFLKYVNRLIVPNYRAGDKVSDQFNFFKEIVLPDKLKVTISNKSIDSINRGNTKRNDFVHRNKDVTFDDVVEYGDAIISTISQVEKALNLPKNYHDITAPQTSSPAAPASDPPGTGSNPDQDAPPS